MAVGSRGESAVDRAQVGGTVGVQTDSTVRSPTLAHAMTPIPFVVRPDDTLLMAHRMMVDRGIRHLPVVQEDRLVGLLSERDILSLSASDQKPRVEDAMSPDPFAVDIATPIKDVVTTMVNRKLGSAIVTSEGRVVGMLTTIDALRLLAGLLA